MSAVTLSRVIVTAVNAILFVFGLAFLVVGVVFKVNWSRMRDAFVDHGKDVHFDMKYAGDTFAIAAIALGCFIVIITVLGFIGVCCDNRCLLGLFGSIVLILVVGQLAAVTYGGIKGKDLEEELEKNLIKALQDYHEDSYNSRSKAFSAIFSTFDCCAVNNATDFLSGNIAFNHSKMRTKEEEVKNMPITCCKGVDYENLTKKIFSAKRQCLMNPIKGNSNLEGCLTKLKDWIFKSKAIFIGVGVAMLLIQILVAALTFHLTCRRKDD